MAEQKAKAQELASRYLEAFRDKLSDPDLTVADLAVGMEKVITVYLMLEGQPTARKEIVIKLEGAEGEVSDEYRVAIKQTLEELLDLSD